MSEEGGGASRSTEPAAGNSTATDVSLREFFMLLANEREKRYDERFQAIESSTEKAFENSQRAIDKADTATEKRFEGVNEFRAALADQASSFVTRSDLTALAEKIDIQIASLRESRDIQAGSRLTWGSVAGLIAAAAAVVGIVAVIVTLASTG